MITISIIRDWKKRFKKDEPAPLEIRVTINRKSSYLQTGIKVRADEFLLGEIVNHPNATELNKLLKAMAKKAYEEVTECLETKTPISMPELKRRIWMTSEELQDKPSFLTWVAQQIPLLRMKEGTMKHYRTVEMRLKEFGKFRKWSDLTTENIYLWDAYLHNLKKEQSDADKKAGKEQEYLSDATVHVHHKCLKALLNRAEKFGIIASNPYNRLRGEFSRGEKENIEYLTEEEMDAILQLHPLEGSQMAVARDLFIFQMFTGLSYSDAQAFNLSNYRKINGVWQHTGTRIKTGIAYISQLLPPAVQVLEKYNMTIPKIGNADYNHMLKAIGYAAGIPIPLHSHLARHTFATYMLRNGVKVENLSKMLGHTNIQQTMRYSKVLSISVHEEFSKISTLLNNKETHQ